MNFRFICPFDTFFQELAFARQTLGIFSIVHFHSSYVLIQPTKKFDSFSNVANVEQLDGRKLMTIRFAR